MRQQIEMFSCCFSRVSENRGQMNSSDKRRTFWNRPLHFWSAILTIACLFTATLRCCAEEFQWLSTNPAEVGIAPEKLEQLRQDLARRKTKAFLLIRHDKIVCEWYSPDHGPDRKHGTASLAKAIVQNTFRSGRGMLVKPRLLFDISVLTHRGWMTLALMKRPLGRMPSGAAKTRRMIHSRSPVIRHHSSLNRGRTSNTATPASPC